MKPWIGFPSASLASLLALCALFGTACNRDKSQKPSSNNQTAAVSNIVQQRKNLPPNPSAAKTTNASKEEEIKPDPAPTALGRREWNVKTTVDAYQKAGFTGPAWDQAAIAALNAFASFGSGVSATTKWQDVIATNCDQAVKAGCKDPMIAYLRARFLVNPNSGSTFANSLIEAATALQISSYPSARKFLAALDAMVAGSRIYEPQVYRQKIKLLANPTDYIGEALNDPDIPIEEAFKICDLTLEVNDDSDDLDQYRRIYRSMEEPLFRKWSEDYRSWLIKGRAYIRIAWIYRGVGYSNTVTPARRKGFRDSLDVAVAALKKGWELNHDNTAIPLVLMTAALGYEESGRTMIEQWFAAAMKVDSNCVAACRSKLYYLEPKWYGSDYFQLAFGRECVESTQWGDDVALMMVEVHEGIASRREESQQAAYWRLPSVWLDLQDAFEHYISLSSNATNVYRRYLAYAIRCERWDKVKELLPKFRTGASLAFEDQKQYDKLVQQANSLAPRTKPITLTLNIDGKRSMARLINRLDFWMRTRKEAEDAFEEYEKVLDKYPSAPAAERSYILMQEAKLCSQKPMFYDRARQLFTRIKTEFANTPAAREADQKLKVMGTNGN